MSTHTDPLTETLVRIGRDMAQQRMAAERHERLGLADRHHYHEYHRFEQGRWAFYESARLICQYFGEDFDAWLNEWGPEDPDRSSATLHTEEHSGVFSAFGDEICHPYEEG